MKKFSVIGHATDFYIYNHQCEDPFRAASGWVKGNLNLAHKLARLKGQEFEDLALAVWRANSA